MRINEKIASVCFIFASVFMIAGRTAFASESVARIGGREYDDIDVALSDAGNGETIVLLDDVKTYELGAETVGESLILDRDLSFDLNGFTLEHGGTTVEIGEGRSLVFTDSSVTDKSAGGSLIFSDTDSEKSGSFTPKRSLSQNRKYKCDKPRHGNRFPRVSGADRNKKQRHIGGKILRGGGSENEKRFWYTNNHRKLKADFGVR